MDDLQGPIPLLDMSERETIDLDPVPEPKRPRWDWLIDRNPLFLISGVFMLVGCFLVSREIHEADPASVGDATVLGLLIALLVVLNVYEFAVIGLGLILSRSRTLVRDTRHLLGLALLLLADASFVYTETGIFNPGVGAAIAGVATLLAAGKALILMRAIGLKPNRIAFGVTTLTIAAMYFLPIAVRLIADDGFLHPAAAYGVWATVGLIAGLHALPPRWMNASHALSEDHRQLQKIISIGLAALPLISLIGHAAAALWVYENPFNPMILSPVLLGAAAILLRQHLSLGGGRPSAQAATLLIASAIVASMIRQESLIYESQVYSWVAISPLRGVLLVSPLLLVWAWMVGGRRPAGIINAALPLVAAMLGHTPGVMLHHAAWLLQGVYAYLPRTRLAWGTLGISSAFACLGLGGLMSWWRSSRDCKHKKSGELLVESVR